MESMLAVIAATWALVMALGPLLQIRKIVEHESSHTISLGYFFVLLVGFVLWLAYGIAASNLALRRPPGNVTNARAGSPTGSDSRDTTHIRVFCATLGISNIIDISTTRRRRSSTTSAAVNGRPAAAASRAASAILARGLRSSTTAGGGGDGRSFVAASFSSTHDARERSRCGSAIASAIS